LGGKVIREDEVVRYSVIDTKLYANSREKFGIVRRLTMSLKGVTRKVMVSAKNREAAPIKKAVGSFLHARFSKAVRPRFSESTQKHNKFQAGSIRLTPDA
jgi:hypothetical protein